MTYRHKDTRKPGVMWRPYMQRAHSPEKQTPAIDDSQAREDLTKTIEKIFRDRERQAQEKVRGLL